MHNPKEDDGERYTVCPIIKGLRGIEPLILYHKEESGSHCLLILDLKPRSTGLKLGSIIIGNGLSYILRRGLQIAALFAIIICIRATIHHKRAGGICEHSSKEDICSYIKSMNNYDRALLLKERHKLLKRNPELLDERRENELHRRYSEEHWPEISFTRTLWHIGTPRWLHSGRTTTSSTSDPDRGTDMQNRTTTNPNLD